MVRGSRAAVPVRDAGLSSQEGLDQSAPPHAWWIESKQPRSATFGMDRRLKRKGRSNQALEQTRDNVLRHGEVVGCELLNFFVRAWMPEPKPEPCVSAPNGGGSRDTVARR
jgi:hypothetical protein